MLKIKFTLASFLITCCLFFNAELYAQKIDSAKIAKAVSGLKMRGVGPAVMGGRIADIAVSPTHESIWYVAVGSGGLWKTTNRGITWSPVFDSQQSYSIGTVTVDPNNPEIVWVGTGENVSGRHVGWGDGVYKSTNGGKSWENVGLPKSEHIGKIIVDPRNSNTVFVAAEGPLWSSGGDRGLYRTTDGGKTWKTVLSIDENTGVTDVEFDPSNPDILYAAAYQRRRKTWALMAGGPNSGIYKSTDNGITWNKVKTGLPSGDMGKIGLAVTPANPQLVYATIEGSAKEKGFYRSDDKGESWKKQSGYTSGGTGPHYYQEIEASPQNPDLIYQMDVFIHVSRDGGKKFDYLGTGKEKHSDNHALWIDPKNGEHLIAGTDGGLYETFDEGTTWRHFPNLPISQFYKLSLDNAEPFYNIVGGAQDLGTLIGPSRTTNTEGVRNQDWYVPLGADGYDNAVDPEDDNIVYMEIQQGTLNRYDKRTQETLNIQPQPAPNDPPERWNWDSPILISPHNPARLYFGSQRVWRSENKGDSWDAISGDLTTNVNRYELAMTDRVWSVNDLYDNGAMSKYATLTSIAESPITEGLLYTGSDDGLIHVSSDGGQNWQKSGNLPKVPKQSFINDIEASRHNANTVFAAADAHKSGDYSPYLFMSTDNGKNWKSIIGDLPKTTIVWVIKQDYVDENLLFIGTEYGIYFSPNKGTNWIQLKAGVPTIPFRDIELHERDNDLVGASFGRGFYVLDDYSPLRNISTSVVKDTNRLFPVRDAWWYIPSVPMQAKGMPTLGSTSFTTDNPEFGAMFTYNLQDVPQTAKEKRQKAEKELRKNDENIPFPGWEELQAEADESKPQVLLLVSDENGNPVRWIKGETEKGLHRTNWDLRFAPPNPIDLSTGGFKAPWASDPIGPLAAPGKYAVALYILHDGEMKMQGKKQEFTVKPTPNSPKNIDFKTVAAFQQKTAELSRQLSGVAKEMGEASTSLQYMNAALLESPKAKPEHFARANELEKQLKGLQTELMGDRTRAGFDESTLPSISSRVGSVKYGHWETTQMPTKTYRDNLVMAEKDFDQLRGKLVSYFAELTKFEQTLEAIEAPWTPRRKLK